MTANDADHDADPEAALRAVRLRFVGGFPTQCQSLRQFIELARRPDAAEQRQAFVRMAHKMAGLAGMLGLPAVSVQARALEELVLGAAAAPLNETVTRDAIAQLQDAFTADMAKPAPSWADPPGAKPPTARVLVVEDDPDQQTLLVAALRQSGFSVSAASRGDEALTAIQTAPPDVVLLDIDLPGASGLDVCRALRVDPDLHGTPVIFLTGRSSSTDRVAGLTVGGDDYIVKPPDPAELRLRITRVLQRRSAAPAQNEEILTQPVFLSAARSALQSSGGVLSLVRLPASDAVTVKALASDMRRRDLVGRYDDRHVIMLMPGVTPATAIDVLTRLLAGGADAQAALNAGVTAVQQGGDLQAAIEQVDEALAEARYKRLPVVLYGQRTEGQATAARTVKVLVAEDDPDVTHILDSRLQASGYQTVLAFDGKRALDAIAQQAPDIVLLDLMLPRLTGFEVLAALKKQAAIRPPVIVVSARGREEDVTRAFDLGADDYITKPFGPEELLARIARLLR